MSAPAIILGHSRRIGRATVFVLGTAIALAGCTTPDTAPTATTSPSATAEGPRVLIECVAADGSEIGTFTRLEEAWASTNYLRIDHCEATAANAPIELTPEEEEVARTASADLPDEDPVDLFLLTLATCVRVATGGEQGMTALPTSVLEAAVELCPEAPQAGLIEDELQTREAG